MFDIDLWLYIFYRLFLDRLQKDNKERVESKDGDVYMLSLPEEISIGVTIRGSSSLAETLIFSSYFIDTALRR